MSRLLPYPQTYKVSHGNEELVIRVAVLAYSIFCAILANVTIAGCCIFFLVKFNKFLQGLNNPSAQFTNYTDFCQKSQTKLNLNKYSKHSFSAPLVAIRDINLITTIEVL